jgi:hypothetical protein
MQMGWLRYNLLHLVSIFCVKVYHPLFFSCYPWTGEYYEHNERGEYKPNIRAIRNNTGSNIIYLYII